MRTGMSGGGSARRQAASGRPAGRAAARVRKSRLCAGSRIPENGKRFATDGLGRLCPRHARPPDLSACLSGDATPESLHLNRRESACPERKGIIYECGKQVTGFRGSAGRVRRACGSRCRGCRSTGRPPRRCGAAPPRPCARRSRLQRPPRAEADQQPRRGLRIALVETEHEIGEELVAGAIGAVELGLVGAGEGADQRADAVRIGQREGRMVEQRRAPGRASPAPARRLQRQPLVEDQRVVAVALVEGVERRRCARRAPSPVSIASAAERSVMLSAPSKRPTTRSMTPRGRRRRPSGRGRHWRAPAGRRPPASGENGPSLAQPLDKRREAVADAVGDARRAPGSAPRRWRRDRHRGRSRGRCRPRPATAAPARGRPARAPRSRRPRRARR